VEHRLAILRIDLERLVEEAGDLRRVGRVRREAQVVAGGGHVHRGRQRAVRRALRLRHVLGGELLPVLAGRLQIAERLRGERIAGARRLRRLERRRRRLGIEQFLVEQQALLDEQVGLQVRSHRPGCTAAAAAAAAERQPLQLHLDQRRRGVRPAALDERLAGGGEALLRLPRIDSSDSRSQPAHCLGVIGIELKDGKKVREIGHLGSKLECDAALGVRRLNSDAT
jgi:hypothetical protein